MDNTPMATPVIELGPAPIYAPDPSPEPVAIVAMPQTGAVPEADLPAATMIGVIMLLLLAAYFWRSAR